MRNRTFFLLAASLIMLMGAAATMLEKDNEAVEEAKDTAALPRRTEFILPAAGGIIKTYGAMYDEEMGQWSLQDETVFETEEGSGVLSLMDGMIERISAEGSGCKICITNGNVKAAVYPVYGVRVFENSAVQQGTQLGTAGSSLNLRIEISGKPVDLIQLVGEGQTAGES